MSVLSAFAMAQCNKKMQRRAFADSLGKPGEAANIREAISKAVKQDEILLRPKLIEPIDYETFVTKNKIQLANDPQRDMLVFPQDDIEQPLPTLRRKLRTEVSTVPQSADENMCLLVRQAIKSYTSSYQPIRFRYQAYSGSYQQLPTNVLQKKDPLPYQVFEIDEEYNEKEDDSLSRGFVSTTVKTGWLLKGPDSGKDNVMIFSRQFKKRFFILRKQSDFTHVLEIYKDERKVDSKGAIFLDLAEEVVRNTKKEKYCFEIRLTARPPCLLAADNEADMVGWIIALNKVINSADTTSQLSRESICKEDAAIQDRPDECHKERSIDHPMIKYSRETDSSLTKARQECRQNLFNVYPAMRRNLMEEYLDDEEMMKGEVVVFPCPNVDRFLLRIVHMRTSLQVHVCDSIGSEKAMNPEPFFLTFALYDAREHIKISEDFHVSLNEPEIASMIPIKLQNTLLEGRDCASLNGVNNEWLMRMPREGIFSVHRHHSEIFLVCRIDKVLQGALSQCIEPYLKGEDCKMGFKVFNSVRHYCAAIGVYHMPFAWSAKPLSSTSAGVSEMLLYRYDGSKFSEEEMFKLLDDFKRPDRHVRLQLVPGSIRVLFEQLDADRVIDNTMTSSLHPVKPFLGHEYDYSVSLEVDEFLPQEAHLCSTFDSYVNHLYVYPLSLKYDSQKIFTKTRNILCCVELKDVDDDGVDPLKRIYGRPDTSVFMTSAYTAVHHHSSAPSFMEEVKIALPLHVTKDHHLLFRFYHISCDIVRGSLRLSSSSFSSSKRKDHLETIIGYSWLPLLNHGRLMTGEITLPVACHAPVGYLGQNVGSFFKETVLGPEVKWVEGARPLFRVRLRLISTVYTQDQHLHNFFDECEKLEDGCSIMDTAQSLNMIKSLMVAESSVYIQFLPTLLNQLFILLTTSVNNEIAVNVTRVMIHIVAQIHKADKMDMLEKYVKYVFKSPATLTGSLPQRTLHEELAKQLTVLLSPGNSTSVITTFLSHTTFFFDVIMKSMSWYLIDSERLKMLRNARFTSDCQMRLQNLFQAVALHVIQKCHDSFKDVKLANISLANFIKDCLSLMDRGYVFRLISKYMENFAVEDKKHLYDLKFEFLRIVCSHEHYIPLALPLLRRGCIIRHYKDFRIEDVKFDFTLSEEYRRNHYLPGLILHELKTAMSESRNVRRSAITILRNLLAKHSFDDRYASKSQQGRIATLYLPFITIMLDCKLQLFRDSYHHSKSPCFKNQVNTNGRCLANSSDTTARFDYKAKLTPQHRATPQRSSNARQTENVFQIISGNRTLVHSGLESMFPVHVTNGSITVTDNSAFSDNGDDCKSKDKSLCLQHFQYQGRKKINTLSIISGSVNSGSGLMLQSYQQKGRPVSLSSQPGSQCGDIHGSTHTPTASDGEATLRAIQEANMSTEMGSVALDILSLYCSNFKTELEEHSGNNELMEVIFQQYLGFMRSNQSEVLQKHIFAAWRSFIRKFQTVLFNGRVLRCRELCFEILRCCNSRLACMRREACGLLYLLMRTNYDHTLKQNFTRVNLQITVAVSQLIGGQHITVNASIFQSSLANINHYANSDKSIQRKSPFAEEVRDLTKRIRTVLMATAAMKENENDPELLMDLHYSLAKSYAATSELRKTWLQAMAQKHLYWENYSEAAHCYIHVAAIVAECLKQRGIFSEGCEAFSSAFPNVVLDEFGVKHDSGMQDTQYSEETLVDFLEISAETMFRAERYEIVAAIYKIAIPIFEKCRNYQKLEHCYKQLAMAYSKVTDVIRSGRRLLGKYYRVSFIGQTFFEEEDGKEYIYKEPKVTRLAEICDRLKKMYAGKFGKNAIKFIHDSRKVNAAELDPKYGYIQVTYVTPYFEENEFFERVTDFEQNNDLNSFMYEIPFTKGNHAHGSVGEQYKRRIILHTRHSFPYITKRLEVEPGGWREVIMTPLEVALDEMQGKIVSLQDLLHSTSPDPVRLQLQLQGCLNAQVNAGPLAYADAFLCEEMISSGVHPIDQIMELKDVFRNFLITCKDGLDLNAKLIFSDQKEYHESIKIGFMDTAERLSTLLNEALVPKEWDTSLQSSVTMSSVFSGFSEA